MNLECSSAGDKRYSAFYAKVIFNGVYDTIENHYQKVKRGKDGASVKKGEKVSYFIINTKRFEPTDLTAYYRLLWYSYFKQNPELVEYAKQFDTFTDKFRGHCINCQADCVKAFVNKDKEFYKCILDFKRRLPFEHRF
jgi:hypothetical protein